MIDTRTTDTRTADTAIRPSLARHAARALRGQEGHRGPGSPARAAAGRPAGPRPRPGGGRARPGQDPGHQDAWPQAIGGEFKRIQFTPDLVPADLVGTRIYNQKTGEFSTSLGPVFTNLLLADEINRAPAKVQSALLEVMQERQVTIGGETYKVPDPFLVLATQNPIETEGTYPLPEAQVDRFMLKVLVDYPNEAEEFVIVERMTGRAHGRHGHHYAAPAGGAARRRQGLCRPGPHGVRRAAGGGHPAAGRLWTQGHRPLHPVRGQPPGQHQPDPDRARPGPAARPRPTPWPRTSATWCSTSCATA